jgi:hypothetical protein
MQNEDNLCRLIDNIHNAPAIGTALEADMWNYLPLICTLHHEDQFQLCFEQFIFVQSLSHSCYDRFYEKNFKVDISINFMAPFPKV